MAKAVPHIVFVHGLNCSGTIFNHLKSQLPKHTATTVEYDSPQTVEESLDDILYQLPALEPITIIGHSLGGLLGHLLCTRDICNLNIQKLVSISSPFGGSEVAGLLRWFFPTYKILKDLSPKSKIIREISENSVDLPFMSIVSTTGSMPFISDPNDGIVTIKSQRAANSSKVVEVNANHFEAVQHPSTISEIKRFVF